jgi:hypothetical protein
MLADGQTQPSVDQSQMPPPGDTNSPPPPPAQSPPPAAYSIKGPFPKLAPYSGIRWRGDVPEVQIKRTWYELVAIDEVPVGQIISFQQQQADPLWRKHFAEDIVEVMSGMNHGLATTVNLQVRTLDADKKLLTLDNVPMTAKNRLSLMVYPLSNQAGLFTSMRWDGDVPQVQVNGTWYDLLAVDDNSARQLIDSAKTKFGDGWKANFQGNVMDAVYAGGDKMPTPNLKLRTLDSNEVVTISVWAPMKN